jgi:CRP-like cAMP-binding protein
MKAATPALQIVPVGPRVTEIRRHSTKPAAGAARSHAQTLSLLHNHPVFGALSPDQLARLCAYATTRGVPAGATLFSKGDPGTALFAIRAGTVKITVPSVDGREAMFNLLHPGEIFGEIALLDGQPRTADAVAMTDCEFTVIERRDFLTFVHSEPKVALKLIELLCARLRWASTHFEEVVFLNLPTRLARTLLRLSQEEASPEGKLAITQRELSHMLGTTRESINKQLRAWARAKWISLERGGARVLAPAALAEIAKGADRAAQKRGGRPAPKDAAQARHRALD